MRVVGAHNGELFAVIFVAVAAQRKLVGHDHGVARANIFSRRSNARARHDKPRHVIVLVKVKRERILSERKHVAFRVVHGAFTDLLRVFMRVLHIVPATVLVDHDFGDIHGGAVFGRIAAAELGKRNGLARRNVNERDVYTTGIAFGSEPIRSVLVAR